MLYVRQTSTFKLLTPNTVVYRLFCFHPCLPFNAHIFLFFPRRIQFSQIFSSVSVSLTPLPAFFYTLPQTHFNLPNIFLISTFFSLFHSFQMKIFSVTVWHLTKNIPLPPFPFSHWLSLKQLTKGSLYASKPETKLEMCEGTSW
jgi:hypothetical protein